jgi:hypothetical protein
MMTSHYPTPSCNKLSETRKLIDNVFNQTDTINETITTTEVLPNMRQANNATANSIFIYQDSEASVTGSQQENQPKETKTSKKYNEDGSLFVYENSIDHNKRKALKVLADHSMDAPLMTMSPSTIDFEPPMASTCNFKQLKNKMISFDPVSSSTCNLKNILNNNNKPQNDNASERLLETILDETDLDDQCDLEKEKLLTMHLNKLGSEGDDEKLKDQNNEKTLSKILAEEFLTTTTTKWTTKEEEKKTIVNEKHEYENNHKTKSSVTFNMTKTEKTTTNKTVMGKNLLSKLKIILKYHLPECFNFKSRSQINLQIHLNC